MKNILIANCLSTKLACALLLSFSSGIQAQNSGQQVLQAQQVEVKAKSATENAQRDASAKIVVANAELSSEQVRQYCPLPSDAEKLLETAIERLNLSARAYYRVRRVAQTIADLADREQIVVADVAEALQYRDSDTGS